jgi:Zn-dependent protease with chaperone function
LQRLHEHPQAVAQNDGAFAALKISGSSHGLMALLFSTHPPLESRIAALQRLP